MPGTNLSRIEERLMEWWQSPNTRFVYPVLSSISISGDPGLRGIRDLTVKLDYPLTVLCGRNGSGKSTILALAALAFHSPAGHVPINAMRVPKEGENFTYYTFSDFFYRGPSDPDITGVSIEWRYRGAPAKTVHKRTEKWMHYERRAHRPVHYLGIVRGLPAIEQRVLRKHFSSGYRENSQTSLSESFRRRLGEILGRPYEDAALLRATKYSVRRAHSGSPYSSFNMGAGEDLLIDLLLLLETCPTGSLIVIEEVEMGLYPEALRRLATHLQEVIWEKKLQVIVSTHSEHFIDAVPREARILIQRAGDAHVVIQQPTTRLAFGHMTGTVAEELNIYCEDDFAARIIRAGLSSELRKKIKVVPVGANNQLCNMLRFHRQVGLRARPLLVWDGDVTEAKVREWSRGSQVDDFDYMHLPGNIPPESWAVQELDCPEGRRLLAEELRSTPEEAAVVLQNLRAVVNPHRIMHELSVMTGDIEEESVRLITSALARLSTSPFAEISRGIETVLRGDRVQGAVLARAVQAAGD